MLVAFCDQDLGNSTPRCSKAGLAGSPIRASRISHSIWSKGCRSGDEKRRSTERPRRPFLGLVVAVLDIELLLSRGLFSGFARQPEAAAEKVRGPAISSLFGGPADSTYCVNS